MFKLAVKTYRINVTGKSFECRLPNGDFVQLSREEAREQVRVKGMTVYIAVSKYDTYHFRCYQRGYDLALARLKVWLQPPPTDADDAYHAVAKQLRERFLNPWFHFFTFCYILWLVISVFWDYPRAFNLPFFDVAFLMNLGMIPMRLVCAILFSAFLLLKLFGRFNTQVLRVAATLSLIFPAYFWIGVFTVPALGIHNFPSRFPFFEIYFPFVIYGIYLRYRRADKQLQRENGLI
jgi:hypothetical protein